MTTREPAFDLGPAAERVAGLLNGIGDDGLAAPTPCGWDVATLLDHLMGLTVAFRDGARKIDGPATAGAPEPSGDALDPAWRRLLPARLEELAAAWREPDAWVGATRVGGVTMPADVMACVALNELVIHGWDLARGTGQAYAVDPASLERVLPFLEESASEEGTPGLFGPRVEVPDDAGPLERALGLSGRDPSWSA